MTKGMTAEERQTQEELKGILEADEGLAEYTKAYIGPGGAGVTAAFGIMGEVIASFFRKWYYIGLTDKRLLQVPKGQQNEAVSYPLTDVMSLVYTRKGGWVSSTTVPGILRISLRSGETLEIKAKGKCWWEHAEQMAAAFEKRKQK